MNMFSNEGATGMVVRSRVRLVYLFGVATIVAIATVPLATGQAYEPPPTVIRVDSDQSKQIFSTQMQDDIQDELEKRSAVWVRTYAVVVYEDSTGEKLLAIGPFSEDEVPLDAFQFLIPPFEGDPDGPGNFEQGIVIYTGSPAGARNCGSTGGTHIRGCNH